MTHHFTPAKACGVVAVRADGSSDLSRVITALQTDWTEFKAVVATKDKEIAAKFDDVVTTDKLEKINANIANLQGAVDQANAQLAAAKLNGGGDREIRDPEYSEAFRAHFRKGAIEASLTKGTAPEGGYLAPVEWDRTITNRLVQVSPMRALATVQSISTNGFTKLFNNRGMGSGWVGETAPRPQTSTPTFGQMTYNTGEIYANPAATQQMLDDAEVDLEAWIAEEVELEFSYQEGMAFVAGNGVNKPAGFLTYVEGGANANAHPWGAIKTGVTTAAATGITADEIIDLIYDLPNEYSADARFVMNRKSQASIRKLKDGQGNYLWQPSFQAGQPATLAMYPITEMPAMPDFAADAFPIAFGDFRRGYMIIDRVGVRVLRDPFTNKPFVHFYTTKRVGGGLLNPDVLRVVKAGAAA
ncbi:phage major capsid protein [Falsirhodobacter halotolerans]|uniref:phage major capsid protein n=1 Tax=Falsirhodobacter halotolerans TaxID=1146892 RepID=UPI001FD6091A|nr:phage major capsid protein [Falsirhodobacter halotolerans]MCJ8139571.1 phage major capsid protein [Falsirhodobacter halotolerans]